MTEAEKRKRRCCLIGVENDAFDEEQLLRAVESLAQEGCTTFLCGMEPGFEMLAAQCVVRLREENPEIRLICVLPTEDYPARYGGEWRELYVKLMLRSNHNRTLLASGTRDAGKRCSLWMMEQSRYMLTTRSCVREAEYARSIGLEVITAE